MNEGKHDISQTVMSRAAAALLERVVVGGDLSKLTAEERMRYYHAVCVSVGLNPITRPFEYLYLQGKMTLYARKDATEQLRKLHGVSITRLETKSIIEEPESFYQVTAYARDKEGREDSATGVVALKGHGEERANCMMKAETKAKRRVTLSLCGLGLMDESEVEIPAGAVRTTEIVTVNTTRPPGALPTPNDGMSAGGFESRELHDVTTLFPTPEQDRAGLIQRAKIGVARMDKAGVAKIKDDVFGNAEAKYDEVDLAALVAFVQAVEVPL